MVQYGSGGGTKAYISMVVVWYGASTIPLYVVKLPPIVCLSSAKE